MIPAAGGTQRLPRVIGEARAKELIHMADLIDATTALGMGLVSRVMPAEELFPTAMEWARRLAQHPPLAARFAKRAINRGMQTDLDSGLEYERYAASMLVDSEDRVEGMRAFVEKRAPRFVGR